MLIVTHEIKDLADLFRSRFERRADIEIVRSTDVPTETKGPYVHVALSESDFPADRSQFPPPDHVFVVVRPREDDRTMLDCLIVGESNKDGFEQIIASTTAVDAKTREHELLHERFDEFVSVAHHDLSETHRAIAFFSDFIRESDDSLGEQTRESLGRISVAGQRSQVLLRDLSRYARVWLRAYQPANLDADEVRAIADMAFSRALGRLEQTNLSLDWRGSLGVRCSERFLGAIFEELFANAFEFHPDPSTPIQVDVSVAPDDQITIAVVDGGPGIRDPGGGRLFRPFYRGKRDDELRSGIGLAMVRAMAERAGGAVSLTPARDEDKWCIVINLPPNNL